MNARTTRAWCRYCEDERRNNRGELGRLLRRGTIARWFTTDPRWHRRRRSAGWSARFDVSQVLLGDDRDPAELKVFCRRHGAGVVDTHELTSASGNVSLYFTALR